MILHDFQCQACGTIHEELVAPEQDYDLCPECGEISKKIVSLSMTSPVDSAWISDVLEVVDKESDEPHNKEFLRHPTRANYKNWMDKENLRPFEPGENWKKKDNTERNKQEIKKALLEKHRERNAISI